MIDATSTGELDEVPSSEFGKVEQACTLCDMCFMTKCPYVPPHEFNLDFPHLMLRRRAIEQKNGKVPFTVTQLTETDRNGKLAGAVAPIANWASDKANALTRPILEAAAGVHREAELPKFHGKTFTARAKSGKPARDVAAPANARKAAVFATCFVNYNNPTIGEAALAVLAQERRRNRGGLSRLLRHAAARERRSRPRGGDRQADRRRIQAVDRQGLRHPGADAVLRPDDEIRMAADRARRRGRPAPRQSRPGTSANTSSILQRRKAWRPASQPSTAASRCISPATRAPRTWATRRPRCCA